MTFLPWQRPNSTEAYAFDLLDRSSHYLAFPWASWIDFSRDFHLSPELLPCQLLKQPLATVGQHIEMLQHTALLRRCGVTDLFWSHATEGLTHHQGLRIHPFPLYPVRCATHPGGLLLEQRRWLYSFQGVYRADLYLTPVRQWILELPPRSDALIASRREWHFEQQVYREHVHGKTANALRQRELDAEATDYAKALQQSVFALCPSGSGPNSIRLWEALGYGAIPVILADTLRLPGDPDLWHQAVLRVPETAQAVAALPSQLEALRAEPALLAAMQAAGQQLWQRYGLPNFVADLQQWQGDLDAYLLSCAKARIRQQGGTDEISELQAHQTASLPHELQNLLLVLPTEQAILVQVIDQAPLPLLETRWKASLQLCQRLLEGRPWAISCRSPSLESLANSGGG